MHHHDPQGQAPLHPSFPAPSAHIPRLQAATTQANQHFARLLHMPPLGGIVLLLAAALALLWANSPWAHSYEALWHAPLALTLGPWQWSANLHFVINDGVMTLFFLLVGMEIRREMHSGALASVRQASLPVVAAIGGVLVPALMYLAIVGSDAALRNGWAIPTATDIAFAVGVLALLGPSIPPQLRIFLLALAIIDDIAAVLIIAFFYAGGLDASGLAVAGCGVGLVVLLQRMGIGSAWIYAVPGAVLWLGLLQSGAHPTLAGVVLGLMTPVALRPAACHPLLAAQQALAQLRGQAQRGPLSADVLHQTLRTATAAQRDALAPVIRLPMRLHPWVMLGVMPLFALANAGVPLGTLDTSALGAYTVTWAVSIALIVGKPLGIVLATGLAVCTGMCRLPQGVNWTGVVLVGVLAGIGFTMAIFVAGLAFTDASLLSAAKVGILAASGSAAVLGLCFGYAMRHRLSR